MSEDRPPGQRRDRGAYAALGVGLLLTVVATLLRDAGIGPWTYLVVAVYGTALSVVGAYRMPRPLRRSWTAFAVSQALFLVADVIWTVYEDVLDQTPSPSSADLFYLASYPAFALGMWWLVAGRQSGRDRASFLDAAILTTGVTVIGVVFFIVPAAASSSAGPLDQVVAAAYPAGDLLLLALVFRLLASGMARNLAMWAILGGVVTILVVDVYYDVTVVSDASYPTLLDGGFLLSYVLLGFAPLHHSARDLSEPIAGTDHRLTLSRVSLLGIALVLAPAAGLAAYLADVPHAPWAVFVGGSVAALLVVIRLWDLVQDLQQNAVQLARLARRDGLTGVANRRTWDHELARACEFAHEQGAPLTVAVLDMDHFKRYNDTYGHLAGDAVLRETASAWATVVAGRGILARYGGEEFTVLLPQLPVAQVVPLLEQLRGTVASGQTCSIGVATWDGAENAASLMSRADQALYEAKRSGRDRVAFHRKGGAVAVTGRAGKPVVHEASGPRELPALRAVYQPVIELASGLVVGAEALSRFEGRDPRTVFDEAARGGYAPELEAAAVTAALEGWGGDGMLALNVSLSTLPTPLMQEALGGDLTGLVLEITETDLVDYGPDLMHALGKVRERGARIAIDDFGVGFSNVHRIAMIQPDVVKLDMSLIRDIDTTPALQAVTRSCVLFAELTAAKIIAEGIETPEERDCVERLGVHLGQGYLFGRPGPMPQMMARGATAVTADTVDVPVPR